MRARVSYDRLYPVEAAVSAAMFLLMQATRLPLQKSRSIDHDDFSLVWPVIRSLHEAGPNWIISNVVPLLCITFVAAQNVIKKSRLPKAWGVKRYRHAALEATDPR